MYLEGYHYKEELFFSNVFKGNITRNFYFYFPNVFGSNIAKKNFSSRKGKRLKEQKCRHFHFG